MGDERLKGSRAAERVLIYSSILQKSCGPHAPLTPTAQEITSPKDVVPAEKGSERLQLAHPASAECAPSVSPSSQPSPGPPNTAPNHPAPSPPSLLPHRPKSALRNSSMTASDQLEPAGPEKRAYLGGTVADPGDLDGLAEGALREAEGVGGRWSDEGT